MLDSSSVPHFQATERFAHEARASSRLQHQNIVSVLDFGQFASQKLYLVMEYLPGKTLASLISESRGGLPVKDCFQIFDQICDAMSYAHEHKILHRDLKPSNIITSQTDDGNYFVKVVDLGSLSFSRAPPATSRKRVTYSAPPTI